MLYFRNVVAAAVAAAAALTVLFCGMHSLFVRSNRTVSRHRAIDCCCAFCLYYE